MDKFVIIMVTMAIASAAQAEELYQGVNSKLGKCFSRSYSQEHLQKHPKQTVTNMSAKLLITKLEMGDEQPLLLPQVKIQAKARNDEKVYGVTLDCNKESGQCWIDCDGPRVKIRYSTNNPGSLLVDNSEGALTLDPLTCGDDVSDDEIEAMSLFLKAVKGGDDIFLLHPMADFECL